MGLSVGFIKGGLWLACWVGAIFATLYGYPMIEPAAVAWLQSKNIISNLLLAHIAVGSGIFIVSLIFLFMLSSVVTGWIRTSRLNALDRSLGFLAGLIAAFLIVAGAYIPISATWPKPEDQPAWLREARLRPVIEWASGIVANLLPQELTAVLPPGTYRPSSAPSGADGDNIKAISTPQPAAPKPADGYSAQERSDMERLIQSTGGK
jgi:membrane protein required for colicin V production